MRHKKKYPFLGILLIFIILLGGCGNAPSNPDTLQMDLTDSKGFNIYETSARVYSTLTVHNSYAVQHLYDAITALPLEGNGYRLCPNDNGFRYRLFFLQGKTIVHTVIAEPTFCYFVGIDNDKNEVHITTDDFWLLLAKTVGVSKQKLFTFPPPAHLWEEG